MTVCVAAICDHDTVIAASDRMLTAGDVQFEPQQSKILVLSTSIAALVAGDSAMQAEIFQLLRAEVRRRIEAEPTNWLNVGDVAELYCHYSNFVRLKRAERAILAPLGLTADSFLARQQQLAPGLATQLATELLNFSAPGITAIFTGVDSSGAHIYVADNTGVNCRDLVGFAAIGAGYWHANSQLMFAGHTRGRPLPETLLLTFSAKKRAEVAPGVGEATDMCMIGPNLGSYIEIGEHVLAKLEAIYNSTQETSREAERKAQSDVKSYIAEITAGGTTKDQRAAPKEGADSTDAAGEHGGEVG